MADSMIPDIELTHEQIRAIHGWISDTPSTSRRWIELKSDGDDVIVELGNDRTAFTPEGLEIVI
jgi:hypothetical protein